MFGCARVCECDCVCVGVLRVCMFVCGGLGWVGLLFAFVAVVLLWFVACCLLWFVLNWFDVFIFVVCWCRVWCVRVLCLCVRAVCV